MVKIDMDNGKRYSFAKSDYDDYEIHDDNLILYKGEAIVGFFTMVHLIDFFVDYNED